MRRFVILEHDFPQRHWDLLIEDGPVLKSWRLAAPPWANVAVPAVVAEDHRLLYLDYEGPISGGRGHVVRWDRGSATDLSVKSEEWLIRVNGDRLIGTLRLVRLGTETWECLYSPERFAEGR